MCNAWRWIIGLSAGVQFAVFVYPLWYAERPRLRWPSGQWWKTFLALDAVVLASAIAVYVIHC